MLRRQWAFRSFVLAIPLLSVCSGCVGLRSLEGKQDGVLYHLPKSILTITVRQHHDTAAGRIWYTIGGPGQLEGTNLTKEPEIFSEIVPDPLHRYVIKYEPSAFSDDRLCVSRKPNGLLYDVQFAADDRTPEIIFNVARFIGGFVGSPAPVAYQQGVVAGDTSIKVRAYTDRVDPFDDDDVGRLNSAVERHFGRHVRIDFSRMREMLAPSARTWPAGCSIKDGCAQARWVKRCDPDHICYRTKLSLPVDLKVNTRTVDVKYADIVNTWDIGTISVTRAFMVQKITKLRFQDGALVAAIVRKPSEAEEVSLLPLNVMNAILSVPSGLWQSALSDQKFKQDALVQLAQNQEKIKGLNDSYTKLRLEGAAAVAIGGEEKYDLNCVADKRDGVASAF